MKRVFLLLCILCLAVVCVGCRGDDRTHVETDTTANTASSPTTDGDQPPHDTLPENAEEAHTSRALLRCCG